ncbi:hypothetical protein Btru_062902 [Bulinus truncatus]|nr:hypothetical protein Btru_062902 [Bulinus truncatus]
MMEHTTESKRTKYECCIEDGYRTVKVLNFHTNQFKEIKFQAIVQENVKSVQEVMILLLKSLDIPVNPDEYDLTGVRYGTPVVMDKSAPITKYDIYLNVSSAHLEFKTKSVSPVQENPAGEKEK